MTPNTKTAKPSTDRPPVLSHYSDRCRRGSIILVDPKTCEAKTIPIFCKSWICPHCSKLKQRRLEQRIRSAHPNKFITLTVEQTPGLTRHDAETTIREHWSKFIAAVRKFKPEFEYLKVIEWTKKGWPHVHVVARSDYLPQSLLATLWRKHVLPGFVDIRKIHDGSAMPREITKYVTKTARHYARRKQGERLFTTSLGFFSRESKHKENLDARFSLVFLTTHHISVVHKLLTIDLWLRRTAHDDDEVSHYVPVEVECDILSQAILQRLSSLPWWRQGYNSEVANPP